MTPKEMIEVLQAFERGEKIEFLGLDTKWYLVNGEPTWNFHSNTYRIAKPEPKKMYAHIHRANNLTYFFRVENHNNSAYWRAPHLDCEIEE